MDFDNSTKKQIAEWAKDNLPGCKLDPGNDTKQQMAAKIAAFKEENGFSVSPSDMPNPDRKTAVEAAAPTGEFGSLQHHYIQMGLPIDEVMVPEHGDRQVKAEYTIRWYDSGVVTWQVTGPMEETVLTWDRNQWGDTIPGETAFVDYTSEEKKIMDSTGWRNERLLNTWKNNPEEFGNIYVKVFGDGREKGEPGFLVRIGANGYGDEISAGWSA